MIMLVCDRCGKAMPMYDDIEGHLSSELGHAFPPAVVSEKQSTHRKGYHTRVEMNFYRYLLNMNLEN
jgi:hypothetical protein